MDDPERPEPELPAREAARVRRRERERTAKDRELMRTGQAKAFKQILDAQAKRAAEVQGPVGRDRRAVTRADDGRTASPADDRIDDDAADPPSPNR